MQGVFLDKNIYLTPSRFQQSLRELEPQFLIHENNLWAHSSCCDVSIYPFKFICCGSGETDSRINFYILPFAFVVIFEGFSWINYPHTDVAFVSFKVRELFNRRQMIRLPINSCQMPKKFVFQKLFKYAFHILHM